VVSWRRRVGAEPTALIQAVPGPGKATSRRKRLFLTVGTIVAVLVGAAATYAAVMGGFPASADVPRPTPAPLTVVTLPPLIPRPTSPTRPATATSTPRPATTAPPSPTTQPAPNESPAPGATTQTTPSPTRTRKHGGGGGDQGN
jgi:hypothetical protein